MHESINISYFIIQPVCVKIYTYKCEEIHMGGRSHKSTYQSESKILSLEALAWQS